MAAKAFDDIAERFLRWHNESTDPAPVFEHVLVSVNGEVPSGSLAWKDSEGKWHNSIDGMLVKQQDYIRFWRYV